MDAASDERYQKWANEKWKNHPCEVCKQTAWKVSNNMGSIPAALGGPYPVVVIYCSNCGNTLLINALVAGIRNVGEAAL